MAFAEIVQSILNYGGQISVGGEDFVFGLSVAGAAVLVLLGVAYKKYGHLLPFVNKKE